MTRDEALTHLREQFDQAYETAIKDIEAGSNNSDVPYKAEVPLSPELIQTLAGTQAR